VAQGLHTDLRTDANDAGEKPSDCIRGGGRHSVLAGLLDEGTPYTAAAAPTPTPLWDRNAPPPHRMLAMMLQRLKLVLNLEILALEALLPEAKPGPGSRGEQRQGLPGSQLACTASGSSFCTGGGGTTSLDVEVDSGVGSERGSRAGQARQLRPSSGSVEAGGLRDDGLGGDQGWGAGGRAAEEEQEEEEYLAEQQVRGAVLQRAWPPRTRLPHAAPLACCAQQRPPPRPCTAATY
jgi:hypothetical protein